MDNEIWAGLIGGITGGITGGVASYFVAGSHRLKERQEVVIRETALQRWNESRQLLHLLGELKHGRDHICADDEAERYVELGRRHRKLVRESARRAQPLLGANVNHLVHELTDAYDGLYSAVDRGDKVDGVLVEEIRELQERADEAIELSAGPKGLANDS